MHKKKLTTHVSAMTFYNLRILAAEAGYDTVGPVIDKLVRNHMVALNEHKEHRYE